MKVRIDYKIFLLMIFFIIVQKFWIYLILLGFCIIHELGHVFVGILLGRKIERIEILPIGCKVNFFEIEEEKHEIKEIIIALAGPLVNLFFVLFFLLVPFQIEYKEFYIYSNFLLGIFNILPIYPLDGGRIVKSLLEIFKNDIYVEEITNSISNVTLIILTMIASIMVIYFKNIIIFLTILYLWSILLKENRRFFLSR